jgi:hypothetical protein
MPGFVGFTVLSGFTLGLYTYSGGFFGTIDDPNVDMLAEKDKIRKTYRVPLEQTIEELGEGRGKNLNFLDIDPVIERY